ncbi:MAG: hypothetical protein Q9208_001334 [Pyrenodesmia sp. 3 TL-2023]
MSFPAQFSLSLELAKVLPIREALQIGVEQLVSLVRALKRTGSDFLVEKDLGEIFGRGKIEPSLEKDFRDVVKTGSSQPLHVGSSISLDAGPGATVLRALTDRFYMSSVIQLSFLTWMHEETTLTSALVEIMLWRYRSNVPGATPDPDYDGIFKCLQACSSQTSQYRWDNLVCLVEGRFPKSSLIFRTEGSPLRYLSPNLLLGAMDYFYMAQSLPEDRFVLVKNQTGLIPIVIWAHHILGLTVLVRNSPDGDVTFGSLGSPQVIIQWSNTFLVNRRQIGGREIGGITSLSPEWESSPTILLLDAKMQLVLKSEPNDDAGATIEGQECHRLKGYGTTFLRRWFNAKTLVADDDPIYVDTANLAVSFAIALTRVMRRAPVTEYDHGVRAEGNYDIPQQCYINSEPWRLFDSSNLFFWDIKLDKRKIGEYLEDLSGKRIDDMPIPTSVRNHLESLSRNPGIASQGKDAYFEDIKELASGIISFAQVVDIGSCADLPLRIAPGLMHCTGVVNWDGLAPIDLEADVWFSVIMRMMRKESTNTTGQGSYFQSEGVYLTCHQGWSLFYTSVGDYDPGEMDCNSLCIKQGIPTNTQTLERKHRIVDAPPIWSNQGDRLPTMFKREDSYLPRCVTMVHERKEHYSSGTDEFRLSIRFEIEELEYHTRNYRDITVQPARYSMYASYSRFHEALWGVVKTIPCPHRGGEDCEPLPLDLDAVTARGLTWANGDGFSPRICICLVKGNARARWLVVNGIIPNPSPGMIIRSVLLRCKDCCVDCAVKAAGKMKGKWLVVL